MHNSLPKLCLEHETTRIPIVWKDVLGYVPHLGHTRMLTDNVSSMMASGRIKPVIFSEVYPLEKIKDGLAALEARKTWGKAIIRVKEEMESSKL
jgi:NADPH:quinone reductase